MGGFHWSPENSNRLREMVTAGLSAGQAALAFRCGLSRNAVLGRAWRMGLVFGAHRASVPAKAKRAVMFGPPRPPKAPRPPPKPAPTPREIAAAWVGPRVPLTLMELRPFTCRFPIAVPEDRGENTLFCGDVTLTPGEPYCAHHRAIAWRGVPVRVRSVAAPVRRAA